MKYHSLQICGFTRQLPIIKMGSKFSIALFSMLGDVDLVEKISRELVKKIKKFGCQILVGPEIKVLPLVYQMGHLLKHSKYIVCREKISSYMSNPIKSSGKNPLVLNGDDANLLKNKKVILVSDVVSTGQTTKKMEEIISQTGAEVVAVVSVLKQGELSVKIDKPFIFLEKIPLFSS